jgi:DNA-binding CsgD family transcriptional regulator
VLELAAYLEVAGEQQRMTDLLLAELDWLGSGPVRGRAYLLLVGGAIATNDDIQRYLQLALAESGSDRSLHAFTLAEISNNEAVIRVARIAEAERWALEALNEAVDASAEVQRHTLYALGWARALRGLPIDDLCERFRRVASAAYYMVGSPERVAGQRLVWRGEVERAQATLARLLSAADERGEPLSYALQRLHLCELELRVGEWDAAQRLLDEWADSAEGKLLHWPMYERCRALLAVGRGHPDEGEEWAAQAIAEAEAKGIRWDLLEAQRARGTAALLAHDLPRAGETLRGVWHYTRREGVDDPGVFPVAPDLVEALVELGDVDEAAVVVGRLTELAEGQDHPWGQTTAKRCDAILRLASEAYDEQAAAALAQAAADFGRLGLRFDRARSLLALGRAQRRFRKWRAAREALEQAVAAFDELGSPGWAEPARSELARVGARRPQPKGELTPAERRVAELAAKGLSNKGIAQALFVTVNTVERHLSHAYAKLEVRSRTQLAARFTGRN